MTLIDLIHNSLDRDYSLDRAAADLGEFMLERDRIEHNGETDSPRLRELDRLIPLQETLALRKLRGDETFDRLAFVGHPRGDSMKRYRPATFLVRLLAFSPAHAETLNYAA